MSRILGRFPVKPCDKCDGSGNLPDDVGVGQEMRAMRLETGQSLRDVAQAVSVSPAYTVTR